MMNCSWRPISATNRIGGMGLDWSYSAYQKQLPFPEHPVHHGLSPELSMTICGRKLPLNFKKFAR
ncbi:hypothetical protein ACNKHM_02065 [Shigella sonnei]